MLTKLFKKYYVQDELVGAAYEGLCPEARGWIKKTIASLYNYYGQPCPEQEKIQFTRHESLSVGLKQVACDVCLVIYDSNYAALSRALAAVCPASFAGIENIYTLAVHSEILKAEHKSLKPNLKIKPYFNNLADQTHPGSGLSLNLLAAWELAGIEDNLALPQAELLPLLGKVLAHKNLRTVRIVILGNPLWQNDVLALQLTQQARIWAESGLNKILMRGNFSKKIVQTVEALHSDLIIKTAKSPVASGYGYYALIQGQEVLSQAPEQIFGQACEQTPGQASVVFSASGEPSNALSNPSACFNNSEPGQPHLGQICLGQPHLGQICLGQPCLVLDKTTAGCWVWPDLALDFFKTSQITLTS